ncbi:MAG: hypothetical protein EF807_08385 [Candidatus Methanolliviera hydrocarbonicum]|uniref:Peptidase A2 domain-containing protein n=1 Tax=Candidatus Methanolliviera hydrocarbonicum TaxID=2491085 RepID=A0A520KUJ6_9EURY|nr:MAG: hypothetical protein EF807_08385 [Candidatus Methanolliviera hydrocarbonicum]
MRYLFKYRKERAKIEKEVYRPVAGVYLKGSDGNWYLFYPYIDSGADISLFTKTDCELLGYNLEEGKEHLVGGVSGLLRIFMHDIPMKIGEDVFNAKVGFADREEVPRLLGRMGIFKRYEVCFDEKDLIVHFIKEEDECPER